MAALICSHPAVTMPANENKLIVDAFGLRDLVNMFDDRWDQFRLSQGICAFRNLAEDMRLRGFNNRTLNTLSSFLGRITGFSGSEHHLPLRRLLPDARFSWHGYGNAIGLEHYDRCVNDFVASLLEVSSGLQDRKTATRLVKNLSREEALQVSRDFLAALYTPHLVAAGAKIWCDDTPLNFLYVDFLAELYPDMKFVHMIRDPRDVISSYLQQTWYSGDIEHVTQMFKRNQATYVDLRMRMPADRILEVRLEDLVEQKDQNVGKLAHFLALEDRFDRALIQDNKTHTGRHSSDLSSRERDYIQTELGDWMKGMGYI